MMYSLITRLAAFFIVVTAHSVGTTAAFADPVGTPPPPTSPTIATDLGNFGYVIPGQTLFHSTYDSGKLFVGTPLIPRLWYKFDTGAGEARVLQFRHWTASTGASYKLYDGSLQFVGKFDDPGLVLSQHVQYYLEVSADHPTSAHFAFEIRPALDQFQNDGGDSVQNATSLGKLSVIINHAHDFYTYFTRNDPDLNGSSTTPGPLTPNFQSPNPAVSKAYYSFQIDQRASIQVFTLNPDTDTYVVTDAQSSIVAVVQNRGTFEVPHPGTYVLEVVDRFTQVSGTNQIRNARIENFEHKTFELRVLNPQPAPAPPTPGTGGTEQSSFGDSPRGPCVRIGSQPIGDCR